MIAYKVSKKAKILFVGINPHPGSYRRGVPFSNNKMFWYLLNRAGFLKTSFMPLADCFLLLAGGAIPLVILEMVKIVRKAWQQRTAHR